MSAITEQLEESGRWLFRWRGYLPLVVVVLTLLAVWGDEPVGGRHILPVTWEAPRGQLPRGSEAARREADKRHGSLAAMQLKDRVGRSHPTHLGDAPDGRDLVHDREGQHARFGEQALGARIDHG